MYYLSIQLNALPGRGISSIFNGNGVKSLSKWKDTKIAIITFFTLGINLLVIYLLKEEIYVNSEKDTFM